MFNLLKNSFCLKGIDIFEELLDACNENEHVDVEAMTSLDFFDFRSTFNNNYKHLQNGETNRTHLFIIDSERGPTMIIKQDDSTATERFDDIIPTSKRQNVQAKKRTPEERKILLKA
eukprot:6650235-Ditylum_brightwellii.AAC.1